MNDSINEGLGFVIHDVARMMRWQFDRRAKRIYLTEKVAPVTKELRSLAREVRKSALQGLSEAEQQLMSLLVKVRSNLSSY